MASHWLSFLKQKLVTITFILMMGWSVIYDYMHPFYNWDMMCYVGTVVSWEETDPVQIYQKTMDTVKKNIPDWVYKQHAENPISKEYTAFNDQIPMCKIKPLYTHAAWLLHLAGMDIPPATWTVSAICMMFMVIVLYMWKPVIMSRDAWLLWLLGFSLIWEAIPLLNTTSWRDLQTFGKPEQLQLILFLGVLAIWLKQRMSWKLLGLIIASVVWLALMVKGFNTKGYYEIPFIYLGRFSTPDTIGTLFVFAAFYAWLQKRSLAAFGIAGVLAALARPDTVIVLGAATAYFILFAPKEWRFPLKQGAAVMFALAASYLYFKFQFVYTYEQYLLHSLTGYVPHPAQNPKRLTWDLYIWLLQGGSLRFLTTARILGLAFLVFVASAIYIVFPNPEKRMWRDLMLIVIASWTLRFIIWPSWGDFRFYYGNAILLLRFAGELLPVSKESMRQALESRNKERLGA